MSFLKVVVAMPDKKPKVSVCIPTYNRAHYIGKTIQSILNQTFSDFELVIVDNASADNTEEVVRNFIEKDNRLRYYKNAENIGLFPNFNRAIELARGDYIAIFHDDDLYHRTILEKEVALLDAHNNIGFVDTGAYEIDEGGNKIGTLLYERQTITSGIDFILNTLKASFCPINCPSVMVRRECYEKAGYFTDNFPSADYDMWLRICEFFDVGTIHELLYFSRRHTESASCALKPGEGNLAHREIFLDYAERFAIKYPEYGPFEYWKNQINSTIAKRLFGKALILMDNIEDAKYSIAKGIEIAPDRTTKVMGKTVMLLRCSMLYPYFSKLIKRAFTTIIKYRFFAKLCGKNQYSVIVSHFGREV